MAYTKEQIEQTIHTVMQGLDGHTFKDDFGYYASLYPEGFSEYDLAQAVKKCPELHPQMVEMVERILSLPQYPVWIDDEEQAGTLLSVALALYDKKHCALFAECLDSQDLDHEVNQNDYIGELFEKWGACAETALLIQARIDNHGQHGPEIVSEMLGEYEELAEFLDVEDDDDDDDDDDDWDEDEDDDEDDDEEWDEGADYFSDAPIHMPSRVSIGQIESAAGAEQLQQLYVDASMDFMQELVSNTINNKILTYKNKNKAALSALAIHLDTDKGTIEYTLTDETGRTEEAYLRLESACLPPFVLLCQKQGFDLYAKTKELIDLMIMPGVTSGVYDEGTFANGFAIAVTVG